MDCKDLQEHYEAFALGALDAAERRGIEAHLARGCPVCAPGVEHARTVVAQLAALAPETDPPARVRRRLMEAVAPPPPAAERSALRRWMPALAWGMAAALFLFAIFSRQQVNGLRNRIAQQQHELDELSEENIAYRRVLAIISAPDTRVVSLEAATSPQIRAYWNEESGLMLAAQNMPVPAAGRTFQLWIVPRQGNPISVDIFRPNQSGQAFLIAETDLPLDEAGALAISDEPAAGSPQPTTTPIWVGPLG